MKRIMSFTVLFSFLITTPTHAIFGIGDIVFDPTNLVQNIAQVLQSIIQVKNQITQIQNMVQNTTMTKAQWEQALPLLNQLGAALNQGQAMAYNLENLDAIFRQKFPGYTPYQDWHTAYGTWTSTTLDTLNGALRSVHMQSTNFLDEQARIQALSTISESAVGRLAAIQAGNAIATEAAQQMVKLRQLMMLQITGQNTYFANQVNEKAQETAWVRAWLLRGEKPLSPYGTGGMREAPYP
jgi:P-type conjugative transfer protein TrbJ